MFDHSSRNNTTVNLVPEAATAEPAVRIELGNGVHWLRPSNVLRLETSMYGDSRPEYLKIIFSDGNQISELCQHMKCEDFYALVDSVARQLWPAAK